MTAAVFTPRPLYDFSFPCFDWIQLLPTRPRGRLGRAPSWQVGLSYPSPPMSGPPSPARRPSDSSNSEENLQDVTMLSVPGARLPTTIEEEEPPAAQTTPERPATGTTAASESTTPPKPPTTRALSPPDPRPPAEDVLPETLAGETPTAIASRGGRRSKAHVANACGNCKRAHLSCDVQRPCNRCVATGKTASTVEILIRHS